SWSVWSHWARSATATLNRSASWESVVRIAWGTNVWWDALAWHSVHWHSSLWWTSTTWDRRNWNNWSLPSTALRTVWNHGTLWWEGWHTAATSWWLHELLLVWSAIVHWWNHVLRI